MMVLTVYWKQDSGEVVGIGVDLNLHMALTSYKSLDKLFNLVKSQVTHM